MAVKFRDVFYSVYDSQYRISIDDESLGTATNTSFELGAGIFDLTYEGQNSQRFNPVIASKVVLQMVINTTSGEEFIEDLVNAEDGRFKVRIEKYDRDAKSYLLFWVGTIITDQVSYEDAPYPFFFKITAIDQLGTLAEIDYNDGGTTYTGTKTMVGHIKEVMDKTNFNYFHTSSDPYITTICNWYDDNHTYDAVNKKDPLINTQVDHIAFYSESEEEEGLTTYMNCLQVLQQIATTFGCRIYQSMGAIRVEQVNERSASSYYYWNYSTAGAEIAKGTESGDNITIDGLTNTRSTLTGNTFGFMPGLKYVRLNYYHYTNRNLLEGGAWSNVVADSLTVTEIASNQTTSIFSFATTLFINITLNSTSTDLWRFEFRLYMQHGTKYLKRDVTDDGYGIIILDEATWESSSDYYTITTDWLQTGSQVLQIPLNFQTPVIPDASGDLTFDFDYYAVYKRPVTFTGTSSPYTPPPDPDIEISSWQLLSPTLELFQDGESDIEELSVYQVDNDNFPGNTSTIELTTYLGDAIGDTTRGKLQVFNGTNFVDSTAWSINQAGSSIAIMKLMIYEILAGQKRGTFRYTGSFQVADYGMHVRLSYDSNVYLLMGGTLRAGDDVWNGTWFHLNIERTNISHADVLTAGSSATTGGGFGGSTSTGGGSPNVTSEFVPPTPQFFNNVSGTSLTSITATLPDSTLADRYIRLYRDGRLLRHGASYDYTIDAVNNEIDLVVQAMGENFMLIVYDQ